MDGDQKRDRRGRFARMPHPPKPQVVPNAQHDQQIDRIMRGFGRQAKDVLAVEESLFEDRECLRYLRAEVMPDDVERALNDPTTPFNVKAACALYPNLKTARMAYLDNDVRIKVLALRNPVVDPGETFDDLDDLDADGSFQAHILAVYCEVVG